MSLELGKAPAGELPPLIIARWVGLAALLAAELLAYTLHFHTGALPPDSGWSVQFLRAMPYVLRFGMAAVAAAVLLGHADLWDELQSCSAPTGRVYRFCAFLAGHLAVLALFLWLSGVVLSGDLARSSRSPLGWTAAWSLAGAAVLVLWGLACLAASDWLRLFRRSWKAMLLGGVMGPLVYTISPVANLLWFPFGRATLVVVHALLSLLFPGRVVWNPAEFEIGTDAFEVRVYPSCSGYAGVAMMIVFVAAYLWIFRRRLRFPAALLMLPAGAAGVWLLNSVRLVALIAIGSWGRPDIAMGGFHKNAGWLAFTAVATCLVLIAGRVAWVSTTVVAGSGDPAATRPRDTEASATTAYLGPFLAILLTTLAAGAFAGDFDWLYPCRVVAAVLVLWVCRRSYGELRGSWSWQAPAFGAAAFAIWLLLTPAGARESGWPAALTQAPVGWSALWLCFRFGGYILMAPLAEELAFRGYLIRRLTAADFQSVQPGRFSWFSFILSSVLFGAMHGRWWLAAMLSGMLFALALRRGGRLIDAVAAHAATNALIVGYVLTTGHWSLLS
jgi:exosortase E/protease (VPEID-CTERM system)